MNDKMTLIQYAIEKYEKEEVLVEKLKNILPEKDIQRNLDTLIGTSLFAVIIFAKFGAPGFDNPTAFNHPPPFTLNIVGFA